jgi:hypothetical protein
MHLKNIINKIRQMSTGPPTNLFLGNFYLNEEVPQTELWRILTENSLTWLLGLKAFAAKPIILTPQKHSGDFWNYYLCPLYINIYIIPRFCKHLKRKNKKIGYLINLKIKRNLIKIMMFRFIYTDLISFQNVTEGIKNFINHGSLIMIVCLNINPDPAIVYLIVL